MWHQYHLVVALGCSVFTKTVINIQLITRRRHDLLASLLSDIDDAHCAQLINFQDIFTALPSLGSRYYY